MRDKTPMWNGIRNNCRIKNEFVLGSFGEFWGTFILTLFAVCGRTQFMLLCSTTAVDNCVTSMYGAVPPILGEALGLLIAVTVFGGVSGGHVNPAVTLGLAVSGKFGWAKLPLYWFMQFFGAYAGAALAYALYIDALGSGISDAPGYAIIFSSLATDRIGIGLLDQIVATAIFVMVIHAAIDERNVKIPKFMYGALFATTFSAINLVLNLNAGGVLNPARDMSARLLAVTVGFKNVFATADDAQYWLVPMFGPLIGGCLGAFIYVLFVGAHVDENEVKGQNSGGAGGQNSGRGDWRNTEFVPRGSASPGPYNNNNNGGQGQPKPEKEKKKKKGFSFGDAMKAGKLAKGGFDMVDGFDPSAIENADFGNVMEIAEMANDAYEQGKDMHGMYKDARELGQKGVDVYKQHQQQGQQSRGGQGQGQQGRGGQGQGMSRGPGPNPNIGYGGPPPRNVGGFNPNQIQGQAQRFYY